MEKQHMVSVAVGIGAFYSRVMNEKKNDYKAFGRRLRLARKVMGWRTTRAFAETLGELETTVSMWERGERLPRHDRLLAIKDATRASLDWLLTGDEAGLSVEMLHRLRGDKK